MKWPCGPLAIARQAGSTKTAPDLKEAAEAWSRPAALSLLKGSPINCLIVDWAHGVPEDALQQQALKPLLAAGREQGITFLGRIHAHEGASVAIGAARAAGLSAVMMEANREQAVSLPVISQFARDRIAWEGTSPIYSVTGNVWPSLLLETMKDKDNAVAGPTGVPWLDSNGWFGLLGSKLTSRKVLWLDQDPPEGSDLKHAANYRLAIADCSANASHWIVSLESQVQAAIARNDPQARNIWDGICETLTFYKEHKDWRTCEPESTLGIISDFRHDNAATAEEVLNLLTRHLVQFRILERSPSLPLSLKGLKALMWIDTQAPTAEQLPKLLAWVRQGGILIAKEYWGPPGNPPIRFDFPLGYKAHSTGAGKFIVAEQGFQDPYQVAIDAPILMSRRNDVVRLYNPEYMMCRSTTDPQHRTRLVQLVNYSTHRAEYVTVWVNQRASSARLWRPEGRGPIPIQGTNAHRGTEFALPPVGVSCVLEMETENP